MPAQIAAAVAMAVMAIVLHELAHGYTALALGDETAWRARRLSFNPLRHVDRVGTILVPGVLILSQLAVMGRVLFNFGWAKPVPVDPRGFRYPRQGMALVALAGPAANFSLAFLAALLFRIPYFAGPVTVWLADEFMVLNIVLGLINLLPLPPLDGGRIVAGILPEAAARRWDHVERYGLAVVLLLLALPAIGGQMGWPIPSISDALDPLVDWVQQAMFRLAGVRA